MATYYWVGGSGTWDNSSTANWATSSGGAGGFGPPVAADTVNFDSNSGTAAVVSIAATAACTTCTVNKSDINLSLSGSPTFAGAFTLTTGTVTLGSDTLTIQTFSSSNTNTRVIAFGTGKIALTGNGATIWSMATATGFGYTGTSAVNCTYSGATGTRTISHGSTAGGAESNAVSFNITAGTDTVTITSATGSSIKDLIFTGFAGTFTVGTRAIYGDFTLSTGMTLTAGTNVTTFGKTSGTQKITTNGKTMDFSVTFDGVGGTFQLQDNLAAGSARTVTLTNGTLDLTGNSGNWTLSCGTFFSASSNIRSVAFGSGNITVVGNSASVFEMNTATNFTYTGTPTINATYSGSTGTRTIRIGSLAGGTEANAMDVNISAGSDTVNLTGVWRNVSFSGFSGTLSNQTRNVYGNLTLSTGMTLTAGTSATTFSATSGPKTITSNGKTMDFPITFDGIGGEWSCNDALTLGSTRALTFSNGTLKLKAGATSTVGSFVTSGTTIKYLASTTPGTQATISDASGTNSVSYLSIQDSVATGGATWQAYLTNNNADAGNNLGWDFALQLGKYMYSRRKNKRILP